MVATTITSVTLSVIPAFLTGALAVLIRRDLALTEAQLGAAVAAFFAASTLTAVWGGHLTERLGAETAMAIAGLGSAASLLGIALGASSWQQLAAFLALGGVANSIAQPATSLGLARRVPARRLGLAFGVKQTNGPVATMLAGLALPAVGLTLGWRWAFALLAVAGVTFAIVVGRRPRDRAHATRASRPRAADLPMTQLVLLALANLAGTAAATSLITFYVESVVVSGVGVAAAGLWFASGSVFGSGARVLWGWVADRHRIDPLVLVIALQVIGAAGLWLLAFAGNPLLLAVVTLIAFVAGWGWFGLLLFAVVQRNPTAPGAASGVVNAGVAAGGIVGPPAFGALVEGAGYGPAWTAATVALLVAAGFSALVYRMPSPTVQPSASTTTGNGA